MINNEDREAHIGNPALFVSNNTRCITGVVVEKHNP